jgi:hypothetical protein
MAALYARTGLRKKLGLQTHTETFFLKPNSNFPGEKKAFELGLAVSVTK